MLRIEVAYSPAPGEVDLTVLELPEGSTAGQALQASGLLQRHPALSASPPVIGIWGRVCESQRELRDRDRVEVYRPLKVDPKEARRLRQRQQPPRKRVSGSRTR